MFVIRFPRLAHQRPGTRMQDKDNFGSMDIHKRQDRDKTEIFRIISWPNNTYVGWIRT